MTTAVHQRAATITGGDPFVAAKSYAENEAFVLLTPATGTLVDSTGTPVANGELAHFVLPGGGVPAIADPANPTAAEILTLQLVDASDTGAPTPSTDAGNTLTVGTDANLYAMLQAKTDRYTFTPAPQPVDLNALGGAGIATLDSTTTALVYVPTEDMQPSDVTLNLRRFPAPTTVSVNIRDGNGLGGTVLGTSNPLVINDTNFVNRLISFPGAPTLRAGQTYTFQVASSGTFLLVQTQANTRPEFSRVGSAAQEVRARVRGVTVPSAVTYNVTTYTDGVNQLVLAVNDADHTDVVDVTAGIPAGWTLVTAGAVNLSGTTLPAAADFSLFVLTAVDGAFTPGVWMSDGVTRNQVFATP